VAEKLWIQSNNYSTDKGTNFVAVRYGNVIGSNGSVIQKWCNTAREKGEIFLINSDMTRFWMSGDMAANLVMAASKLKHRKVTLIPKLKAANMGVFARAFLSAVYSELGKVYIKNMQARGAEKLHETLVSQNESAQCVEVKDLECYTDRCYMRFGDDIPVPTFKRYLSFSGLSSDKAQMWNPDDLEKEISEAIYGQSEG
jgi:FlaA1/EpsC-like NDP-sugar epimerase